MGDEERKRRERARRLREEIEELESGVPPTRAPQSPREFIERETAAENDSSESDDTGDDEKSGPS